MSAALLGISGNETSWRELLALSDQEIKTLQWGNLS